MVGQYLATRGEQGYVVTDVSEPLDAAALDAPPVDAAHLRCAPCRA